MPEIYLPSYGSSRAIWKPMLPKNLFSLPETRMKKRYSKKGTKRVPKQYNLTREDVKALIKRATARSQERKRLPVAVATVNNKVAEGYIINPFYNVTQGVAESQRVGCTISLDSIHFRGQFTAVGTQNSIRMIGFWSSEQLTTSNSAWTVVTNANLLTSMPLNGNNGPGYAGLSMIDFTKCSLAFDRRLTTTAKASNGATPLSNMVSYNFKHSFKGKKVDYLLDTVSYFKQQNFYVLFITDGTTSDTTATVAGVNTLVHEIKFKE